MLTEPEILSPLLWLLRPAGWGALLTVWAIALVAYAFLDTAIEKSPDLLPYAWVLFLACWNLYLMFTGFTVGLPEALGFCLAACLLVGAPLGLAAGAIWWRHGSDWPCAYGCPPFGAVLLEAVLLPLGVLWIPIGKLVAIALGGLA